MTTMGSVSHWIVVAEARDEAAAQELWNRYFTQLVKLAHNRLSTRPPRGADAEDMALSAFNSFFKGLEQGRFPQLRGRNDLWRLLVVITARKVIDYVQHEGRQKRGGGRIVGESGIPTSNSSSAQRGIEQVIGDEPTPEFAVSVAEECELLLEQLGDAMLREVAQLKLEAYTNEEISQRLDCSLRTVERKLWLIRAKWSGEASHE